MNYSFFAFLIIWLSGSCLCFFRLRASFIDSCEIDDWYAYPTIIFISLTITYIGFLGGIYVFYDDKEKSFF